MAHIYWMTLNERNKLYRKAIEVWGDAAQQLMVVEECAELIRAIMKSWRGYEAVAEICEEIADVEIMIEQMRVIFDEIFIDACKEEKLERLAKRIKEADNERDV